MAAPRFTLTGVGIALLSTSLIVGAEGNRSRGQVVYVPVYSEIPFYEGSLVNPRMLVR